MEAGCYFTFYIEWTSLIVLEKFCYFEKSQMSFNLSKRGRIFESPKSQLCVTCYKSDRHSYHEWTSVTLKRVRYRRLIQRVSCVSPVIRVIVTLIMSEQVLLWKESDIVDSFKESEDLWVTKESLFFRVYTYTNKSTVAKFKSYFRTTMSV